MIHKIKAAHELAKANAAGFLGDKRGLAEAPFQIIMYLVILIIVGIAATVLINIQGTQTQNSTAYNATGDGLTGIGNFADLMPVLGTILAAVLIIGAIIGVVAFFRNR